MSKDISDSFETEKNKKANAPIEIFEFYLPDGSILEYTSRDTTVKVTG